MWALTVLKLCAAGPSRAANWRDWQKNLTYVFQFPRFPEPLVYNSLPKELRACTQNDGIILILSL